jgi:hypothetical protein
MGHEHLKYRTPRK